MKKLLFLFVILALVTFACGGTNNNTSNSRPATTEELAWTACTLFVEKQLGVSQFDAQEYTASGVSSNGATFTAAIYYAKVQSKYQCVMDRHSNGDFQLNELNLMR